MTEDSMENAIAIIGLEGRFPNAENLEAFWENLSEGRECLRPLESDELDPGLPPELTSDPAYVPVRGTMPHADRFDAEFFGISPREAEILDPQHRVFLEMAWSALEHAGYPAGSAAGLVGVFACMSNNTYLRNHVARHPDVLELFGELPTMVANEKDYLATRVAYKLNLQGPALSFSTACSSSLVAVSHAFHSLLDYQCDLALAGGVAITCPQYQGYRYQEGGIYAADGHCRAFDAAAGGTVFSNGGGLVVMKRLADALEANDTIHAVLRGAAINNDGGARVSLTAPGVAGQSQVVELAQAMANVSPADISYIEAHGTGTALGDPIEVEALNIAFGRGSEERGYCALGSVKPSIGHLDVAAGIAGLLKTVLALKHRRIPATLNFRKPNPALQLDDSPFYIASEAMDWEPRNGKRIAGVSAFGLGGTNAHVIVEEAPSVPASTHSDRMQLLPLSAKTEAALHRNLEALADYLENHPAVELADVAFTLQHGRAHLAYRNAVPAGTVAEAIDGLREAASVPVFKPAAEMPPRNVFLFPGQGVQRPGMFAAVYEREPVFRECIDRCAEILSEEIDHDIRDLILGRHPDAAELLDETRYTQPALFAVEYALARLWMSWGIRPDALAGHSIGEFPAATLAGVFRLQDALRLVAARGRLMWQQERGSMLSVRIEEEKLLPLLREVDNAGKLTLAAINAPQLVVVSGEDSAIDALASRLDEEEIPNTRLHTSHAFHSPMMEPVAEVFEERVAALELSPPEIPIISTMTGRLLTDDEATDPHYWARQLREPVRFAAAMKALDEYLAGDSRLLIDVGPGAATGSFARQCLATDDNTTVVGSAARGGDVASDHPALLAALGMAWSCGAVVDWNAFQVGERRQRIPLPTYSFERTRYWLESTGERPAEQAIDVDAGAVADGTAGDLESQLVATLAQAAGIPANRVKPGMKFSALGLDSLFLIQFSQLLRKRFGLELRVRQLLDEFDTLDAVIDLLNTSNAATQDQASDGRVEAQGTEESPPQPGARLGRRPDGTPAWFIPDPENPGRYRELR